MHEMGIADSVLTAVIAETARYPGNRACKVGLRIGELAGIDPDSLRFCFDALIKDSELDVPGAGNSALQSPPSVCLWTRVRSEGL